MPIASEWESAVPLGPKEMVLLSELLAYSNKLPQLDLPDEATEDMRPKYGTDSPREFPSLLEPIKAKKERISILINSLQSKFDALVDCHHTLTGASTDIHGLSLLISLDSVEREPVRQLNELRSAIQHYEFLTPAMDFFSSDNIFDDLIELEKRLASCKKAIEYFSCTSKSADAAVYKLKYTQCLQLIIPRLEKRIREAANDEEFFKYTACFSLATSGLGGFEESVDNVLKLVYNRSKDKSKEEQISIFNSAFPFYEKKQ